MTQPTRPTDKFTSKLIVKQIYFQFNEVCSSQEKLGALKMRDWKGGKCRAEKMRETTV